ncbi:MAG: Uma2 family endonuclease, partial [Aquificaceae bacterium]|nr:Uma2 family endonuclease [Aquificaceae bacterium]
MKLVEKKYTAEDYEKLPEGSPYQLIEGELIMSPSPSFEHFKSQRNILRKLFETILDTGRGE